MEGRCWKLDASSFDVAKKAWRRLCASDQQRHAESRKRQARASNQDLQQIDDRVREMREREEHRIDESNREIDEPIYSAIEIKLRK